MENWPQIIAITHLVLYYSRIIWVNVSKNINHLNPHMPNLTEFVPPPTPFQQDVKISYNFQIISIAFHELHEMFIEMIWKFQKK